LTGGDELLPAFLDHVWDCVVSHACHDLPDVPHGLWEVAVDVDSLETASRLFALEYYWEKQQQQQGNSTALYDRFVSLYYGYYFVTVLQRMRQAIDDDGTARDDDAAVTPLLYVQVTSDSIVSPMLRILGHPATRRPVWGSQVVYQLLQNMEDGSHRVRILHEGDVLRMESLDDFAAWVDRIAPAAEECSTFYDNFP
jgi:hypothetical protein